MRLLEYNSTGQLSLTKAFMGDNTPQYAILSHTWGADTEEVTYRDLMDGIGESKAGYGKIRLCGEWAKRDGLRYFWVDTCCIDKSNSVELQEAINSMFRWYRNAVKCYVYLSDVSTKEREGSDQFSEQAWESAFRSSRWFTRGWTIQELIAPTSVEFFSKEEEQLGNKRTLEQQLHEITGIAISALRGAPLSQFSVDERLSWAKNRKTTREEDIAYSLLGIFNVHMPMIYSEGRENAFRRLREEINKPLKGLEYLPIAADAPFNSFNRQDEPTCLPHTRVDLLRDIHDWANGQDERYIFWLNGLAGTGKSTIARTVARRYFEEERLGASFFFVRGGGDISHAGKFFTSIAVQLANNIPSLRQYIYDAINKHKDIASQSLRDQWCQLILRPLLRLGSGSTPCSYLLIVDALDECDKEEHIRTILQLLAEARVLETIRLRVFLTSRPEIPIRHGFYQIPDAEHQDFILHNISQSIVNHDISIFLQHNLNFIASERSLGAGWPGEQIIKRLVHNASGLFIWAATACRFIYEGKRFATKRLDIILESSNSTISAPEKHLNKIYLTVLRQSISPDYTDEEKEALCYMIKSLLGSVVTLFSPLSTQSLAKLVNTSQEEVDQTLDDLHAILDIPKSQTCPLRLHHPSFRDFLLNKERCGDSNFQVDEKQAHQALAKNCIRLMLNSIKQNICGQEAPGIFVVNVESTRIEQCLPQEVRYACLYWVQHLQASSAQLQDGDYVHQFLRVHLLHWLEALSWIGKVSEGILAITSLDELVSYNTSPNLHAFIHDIKRFALYNRPLIEQTPLQLYCSALVFAPDNSIVRGEFKENIPTWIQRKPKVQANWNAILQTLEGHTGWVQSVAFSPDSKKLVSSSTDNTVRLWDAVTGAALQTLEGHTDWPQSVAFSPDSKQVMSCLINNKVRLWDAVTGVALQTLEGHTGWVNSVAFSPDGRHVVSGSHDQTVRLWDAITGAALQIIEAHTGDVRSVAFSPNGKRVVSGSSDATIRLWDAVTGAALHTIKGHIDWVRSVAFSPDSKQVVSGSSDKTVRLWDAVTGAALQTLEGHTGWINSVAFSPDGKQVVSCSSDNTVRLWDTVVGVELQTLEGHTDWVQSVAFSPDGKQVVSSSRDKTVRLWDAVIEAEFQTIEGYTYSILSVAFSPDGKQVVSGSYDRAVRVWDAVTGVVLRTLEGHTDDVHSVAFSPDSKRVASGSNDATIRIWDAITGAALHAFEGHEGLVTLVAFSPDGKRVVSVSSDQTIRLWDTVTGAALQTLEDHIGWVNSVVFSPDGKQIASGSYDWTVRLWDTTTGAALQTLEGHMNEVLSVAFSPDGKQVVSGSSDDTVRLWDAATGAALQTLKGHTNLVKSVTFSPDGKQILSSSLDKTVRLWNVVTGAALQTIEAYIGEFHSISFSPSGKPVDPLLVSSNWITEGGKNILWLPPEYRAPTCVLSWNRCLALGYSSGRIFILGFEEGPKLI